MSTTAVARLCVLCAAAPSVAVRTNNAVLAALDPTGETNDAHGVEKEAAEQEVLANWATTAAGAALAQLVSTMGAGAAGKGARANAGASSEAAGQPGVRFDQPWFERTCDVKKSAVSNNVFYSQGNLGLGSEWNQYKKCDPPDAVFDSVTDDETCTNMCRQRATQSPGEAFCCEFNKDDTECSVARGVHAMQQSTYGTTIRWRTPKQARFVKIAGEGSPDGTFSEAEDMQRYFNLLIEQVNHMSIPGILEHMLSFYVCMRWVPDDQFMQVAKFEQEHTDVDDATQHNATVGAEDLIRAYTDFEMIPLKCTSSIGVRDLLNIDTLLEQFSDSSDLKHAYEFSKEVASKTWRNDGSTFTRWSSRITETQKVMNEKLRVNEFADVAHRVLPWDGFIRSSASLRGGEGHDEHISKPKNLFFLCFGPRIASFPHKREGGAHVLADQNMAGCNGLWDFNDMTDHLRRIKRMFSPETCLVEGLEKKLKAVFLHQFMTMNIKFEEVLNGEFKREDAGDIVRATPEKFLQQMLDEAAVMNGTEMALDSRRTVHKKYERTARLLANAHSKWLVCDTKPTVPTAAFGFSDDAFRSETAYSKWLPQLRHEGELKCTVFDGDTGCLKCTTGIFSSPNRCAMKDTIGLKDIFQQVKKAERPIVSPYMRTTKVKTAVNASEVQFETKQGFCLGSLNSPRTGAPSRGTFDRVVRVEKDGDGFKTFQRPEAGLAGASKVEACLHQHNYGAECRNTPQLSRSMFSKEGSLYIDTNPGCPAEREMAKVRRCAEDLDGGVLNTYPAKDFGPLHVFEEFVPTTDNKKEHYVQFVYVCPCSEDDNSVREEYSSFAKNDPLN